MAEFNAWIMFMRAMALVFLKAEHLLPLRDEMGRYVFENVLEQLMFVEERTFCHGPVGERFFPALIDKLSDVGNQFVVTRLCPITLKENVTFQTLDGIAQRP